LQEVFYWADHTYFTTASALAQAQRICGDPPPKAVSALTPGAGPRSTPHLTDAVAHDSALRHRLSADSDTPPDAVVLGWGALDYQNGVDLFLTCARILVQKSPGKKYMFAWLAQPGDAASDPAFGVLIHEQIAQAGLSDHVAVIHEPLSLQASATLADLILIPARSEVMYNHLEALRAGI